MKHQAAGRDHQVTAFMAQYSHPNSATALGRPQQRPARSSLAGLHQPAAAIAKARAEDIGTATKQRTELGVLGEFAPATTVGAARTESFRIRVTLLLTSRSVFRRARELSRHPPLGVQVLVY